MSICFHNNPQYNLDTLEITLSNKIQKYSPKTMGNRMEESHWYASIERADHLAKNIKKTTPRGRVSSDWKKPINYSATALFLTSKCN